MEEAQDDHGFYCERCGDGGRQGWWQELAQLLHQGKLVPASLQLRLLLDSMQGQPSPYLVTGFPRSVAQLQLLEGQTMADGANALYPFRGELGSARRSDA